MEHYKNLSLENIEGEIWKDIPEYEGYYQASTFGRIKRLSGYVKCLGNTHKSHMERILMQSYNKTGYLSISLSMLGIAKSRRVNRLIAITFIINPENKPAVNHVNGIKTDNRVSELEWVTNSENELHSFRVLGKKSPMIGMSGNLSPVSKSIIQKSLNGGFVKTWECISVAARYFNKKNSGHIRNACAGIKKTAYGYKWEYNKVA